MVFGQFVDILPLFASQHKAYIDLAAILMVCSSLLMAGVAGYWPFVIALASDNTLFFISLLLTVLGIVLQDFVG